ncbi:MAG TPA: class I SAM-dependent methyltransferase [Gemmatimonadaceae bacterium]|nr:class I SAM-dependent methyltransferase [Gemmatimonadaceae bacterium]
MRQLDDGFQSWYRDNAAIYDSERFTSARERQFVLLENETILRLLKPQPGMKILDIGTGTGRASLAVASRSGAQVIGLDLTPQMLKQAQHKRAEAEVASLSLVCANARQLPFEDETFDAVMSIRMVHLFPAQHWPIFINEMTRVLRPGGSLLVEFDSPLAGGGWVAVRELRRRLARKKRRYYLWPWNCRSLFGTLEDCQVHGFWFPGVARLAERSDHLRTLGSNAHLVPPFGFLGNYALVHARKRAGVATSATATSSRPAATTQASG